MSAPVIVAAENRCVLCGEIRHGPVISDLPAYGPRAKKCVCLECARRVRDWFTRHQRALRSYARTGDLHKAMDKARAEEPSHG